MGTRAIRILAGDNATLGDTVVVVRFIFSRIDTCAWECWNIAGSGAR